MSLRQLCPLFHPEIVPERDCARVYGVFDHGTLIAVQNGTSPGRVVAFDLDPSLTRVTSETIIDRSTKTLGDPTHGVIIDDDFYYIANSGWDVIDDHGNMRPGAKPSEPRVMGAQVQRINLEDQHGADVPVLNRPEVLVRPQEA